MTLAAPMFGGFSFFMGLKSILIVGAVIAVTTLVGWIGFQVQAAAVYKERNEILLDINRADQETMETQRILAESETARNLLLAEQINELRRGVLTEELSSDEELPICSNCRLVLDQL